MVIYKILGIDEELINLWYTVHEHWRYKGMQTRGDEEWMRLSGQATTAIGNVITNMQVHQDMILEMMDNIEVILMLGDDNLIAMN